MTYTIQALNKDTNQVFFNFGFELDKPLVLPQKDGTFGSSNEYSFEHVLDWTNWEDAEALKAEIEQFIKEFETNFKNSIPSNKPSLSEDFLALIGKEIEIIEDIVESTIDTVLNQF